MSEESHAGCHRRLDRSQLKGRFMAHLFSMRMHPTVCAMKLPPPAPLQLTRSRQRFNHADWIVELKRDGFRALAHISNDGCRLASRRDNTFKSFNPLGEALRNWPVKHVRVDAEIGRLDGGQNSMFSSEPLFRRGQPYLYALDLRWLNGEDLRYDYNQKLGVHPD
jgi:ATP-dependent DNA ligase